MAIVEGAGRIAQRPGGALVPVGQQGGVSGGGGMPGGEGFGVFVNAVRTLAGAMSGLLAGLRSNTSALGLNTEALNQLRVQMTGRSVGESKSPSPKEKDQKDKGDDGKESMATFKRGLYALQGAAQQAAGRFSGILSAASQVVGGAFTAVAQLAQGNLLGALGGLAIGLAGLAVGALATVAVMKSFASAAAPDHLSSFSQAIDILTGTIGIALVPMFVLLGASLLTAAAIVGQYIAANSDAIAKWYAEIAPYFEDFGKSLGDAIKSVMEFVGAVASAADELHVKGKRAMGAGKGALLGAGAGAIAGSVVPGIGTVVGGLAGGAIGAIGGWMSGHNDDADTPLNRRRKARDDNDSDREPGASKGGGFGPNAVTNPVAEQERGVSAAFLDNFRKIMSSMQNSFSGRTGYSQVDALRDQIQEQNLQTELQRDMLQIQKQSLDELGKIYDEMSKPKGILGR